MLKSLIKTKYFAVFVFILALFCMLSSCDNFLDVDPPKSEVENEVVFDNDVTATSAILGIYVQLVGGGNFLSGDPYGMAALSGLSSDELSNGPKSDPQITEFETNSLTAENAYVSSLWTSMYKTIYQANVAIESLGKTTGVTKKVKDQLLGESLFIRAFAHFYLINFFDDVPLVISSDYIVNSKISRTEVDEIYNQIEQDLLQAEQLMDSGYVAPGKEKIRPNKFAATALLSRVYLYQGKWSEAEIAATNVINSGLYSLEELLSDVFLKNSDEAIWQLQPLLFDYMGCTQEGRFFSPNMVLSNNVMNRELALSFESGDSRVTEWVGVVADTIFFPYKYKQSENADPSEYSMIIRLAELYLIRAEARAMLEKLEGDNSAISDINMIRSRAGLLDIESGEQADLLRIVEAERRSELFTEGGHRWLDLKRWSHATDVLADSKPDFSVFDELYPLPQSEFLKNPLLIRQNEGY